MSYDFDVNGVAYQYQQYAEVTAVSPNVGSTAGGAVLTISGRGFPTLSLGLNDTVVVSVQGVPCTVLSSTYSTITCRTGPQPATDPLSATPLRGTQYPGMRGIEYELYNVSQANMVSFNNLASLNNTITVATYPGSYKAVVVSRAGALRAPSRPSSMCGS